MDNLVSLFNYNSETSQTTTEEVISPFIVFDTDSIKNILCLSPSVMQLEENIFVADLSQTSYYWENLASKLKLGPKKLLSKILQSELPSNTLLVSCDHPFTGLILINHLIERSAKGSYDNSHIFTNKIFQNIGWNLWSKSAEQLNSCFEKHAVLKKERKNFQTSLAQFERFITRLKLDKISELNDAHFHEIQRRFKSFIGLLFKWTFPNKSKKESIEIDLFNYQTFELLIDFPWINLKLFEAPTIKNTLEHALSLWEHIEALLKEDLEKFTSYEELKYPNKISSLKWNITLFDISDIETEIFFRYPLSFEEDRVGNFSIISSQFKIAFEQFQFKLKEKTKDTDLENVPLIIAWEIKIDKIVRQKEKTGSLFIDLRANDQYSQNVKELQNKIDGEISVFKINKIHIPSLDYSIAGLDTNGRHDNSHAKDTENENFSHRRFLMKPLFIYPEPLGIEPTDIRHKRYLERTSAAWWQTNDLNDSYRDYHICEKNDGQLIWAYQNYKGAWYIHGLYS